MEFISAWVNTTWVWAPIWSLIGKLKFSNWFDLLIFLSILFKSFSFSFPKSFELSDLGLGIGTSLRPFYWFVANSEFLVGSRGLCFVVCSWVFFEFVRILLIDTKYCLWFSYSFQVPSLLVPIWYKFVFLRQILIKYPNSL